jgi:hypothetical protein
MNEDNIFLRAAIFYARRGMPVFPVRPHSKAPPLTPRGCLDASTDLKQVEDWWKRTPAANVALRTGIWGWALDIDRAKGGFETLEELEAKHGKLRSTMSQITGGNGYQYFYAPPEQAVIKNGENVCGWQGIDVRGENGYCLVQPSIHPSGGKYFWDGARWEQEGVQPADAWLLEALLNGNSNGNGTRRKFELPERIPHGQQHKYLVSLAGKMRAAFMGYDEIVAALWEVNQTRCERPGPRNHIEQYARSVCNYVPGPQHEPAPTVAPSKPLKIVRGGSIYDAEYGERKAIIEPILFPGLTLLAGRPKMGKGWFAFQMAVALVTGGKLAGYLSADKPRRVLYLSLEDRDWQVQYRMRKLNVSRAVVDLIGWSFELEAPLMTGGAEILDKTLEADPVDVLFVDSQLAIVRQAKRMGLDVMQADYNISAALRSIAEKFKIAVVLINHTTKAARDYALDAVQGTTGTTAAADAGLIFQRVRSGETTLSVIGRQVPENVYGIERAPDSPAWRIISEGDEATQSEFRRDILQLLRDKAGDKGMKASSVAQVLRKPVSSTYRQLAALTAQGLVRVVRGNYTIPGEDEPDDWTPPPEPKERTH